MKWYSRNVDPALFPLIFNRGQLGYRNNYTNFVLFYTFRLENGIPLQLRPGETMDDPSGQIHSATQHEFLDEAELGIDEEFLPPEEERQHQPRDHVSRAQFFRYLAHQRSKTGQTADWKDFHWLWTWRKLAQLYCITVNNRNEAQKVAYMKKKQSKTHFVRVKTMKRWLDAMANNQGGLQY